MDPIDPAVMLTQAAHLGHDLRSLTEPVTQQIAELVDPSIWTRIERIYLTGDGDSYHASQAAQLAFTSLAGIDCQAISAQQLLAYGPNLTMRGPNRRALVIGTSASGGTELVRLALTRAREAGALTMALTGRPGSPTTRAAEHNVVMELDRPQPSPGIRTYQASLLGMLLLAIHLSGEHPSSRAPAPATLRKEILDLAEMIEATATEAGQRSPALAQTLAASPVMMMIGSGPAHGTAMFAAAKIIEASGIFATGRDLEEWSHVERFARPFDMPVIVIAPPGRTHQRAVQAATQARSLGRYVIAVCEPDDIALTSLAHTVMPVLGSTREEFSPLLYHPFAAHLSCRLAQHLDRTPFQSASRSDT